MNAFFLPFLILTPFAVAADLLHWSPLAVFLIVFMKNLAPYRVWCVGATCRNG